MSKTRKRYRYIVQFKEPDKDWQDTLVSMESAHWAAVTAANLKRMRKYNDYRVWDSKDNEVVWPEKRTENGVKKQKGEKNEKND